MTRSKRNVIGIISIKGGVGKTTCTVNLGAALSSTFGKKTLIVDANFSAPNLGLHLGLSRPSLALGDVMRKGIHISQAVHNFEKNLHVIPGALSGRKINPFQLRGKLDEITDNYDSVLLDSSPNLGHEMLSTMLAADELLVVTTPDLPTLSCTMHAVRIARTKRTPILGIILNKVRHRDYELNVEEIENASEAPVLAVLPDEQSINESLALAIPAVFHRPVSNSSVAYNQLAAALAGSSYSDPRVVSRIRRFFARTPSKLEMNRALIRKNGI